MLTPQIKYALLWMIPLILMGLSIYFAVCYSKMKAPDNSDPDYMTADSNYRNKNKYIIYMVLTGLPGFVIAGFLYSERREIINRFYY